MKKYGGIIRWLGIRLLKGEICIAEFIHGATDSIFLHLRLSLNPTSGCYNQVSEVKQR